MALDSGAVEGLGPIETRDAWPRVAADFDPISPIVDHWFASAAACVGEERERRLEVLAACVEVCRRTFTHRAKGAPSRDLEHTRGVQEALVELRARASQLTADDIVGFAHRARALLKAMPGRMALLRPESPHPVSALPEIPSGETMRTLLAHEARAQPHAIMRRVDRGFMLRAWVELAFARTGRWIDLGSADGRSLVALAARSRAIESIGVDVAWSFSIASANRLKRGVSTLPEGVRYLLLGVGGGLDSLEVERIAVNSLEQRFPDRLAARTVASLGAHEASVVSLLYPIHMPQVGSDGVARPALEFQLATAVKLLAPGGVGLFVTEDVRAWKHGVAALMSNSSVENILYCGDAMGAEQLQVLGVFPYAPTMGELDPSLTEAAEIEAPGAPFAWGLPLIFTTRAQRAVSNSAGR